MLGGPVSNIVDTYLKQKKKRLSDPEQQNVCDTVNYSVHVSLVSDLTLEEYIAARREYCSTVHSATCIECSRMLHVASCIIEHGFLSLSSAFAVASPGVSYTAEHARSKLLQLPVVSVRIGNPLEGRSCKEGKPDLECTWYPGGPPLTHLPLPLPDPDRPWGSPSCTTCKGFCAGHYRSSVPTDTTDSVALSATSHPPSSKLKELFNKLQGRPITDQFVHDAAKKVLLPPEEVRIWLEHLSTVLQNRRRGAAKAAVTRKARKAQSTCVSDLQGAADPSTVSDLEASCYCGGCGKEYQDETEDVEVWIGCDMCESWYCMSCEGLTDPPEVDMYICTKCQ